MLSIENHFDIKIDKIKKTILHEFNPLLCACNNNQISTINYLLRNVYNGDDNNDDDDDNKNDSKMFVKNVIYVYMSIYI